MEEGWDRIESQIGWASRGIESKRKQRWRAWLYVRSSSSEGKLEEKASFILIHVLLCFGQTCAILWTDDSETLTPKFSMRNSMLLSFLFWSWWKITMQKVSTFLHNFRLIELHKFCSNYSRNKQMINSRVGLMMKYEILYAPMGMLLPKGKRAFWKGIGFSFLLKRKVVVYPKDLEARCQMSERASQIRVESRHLPSN